MLDLLCIEYMIAVKRRSVFVSFKDRIETEIINKARELCQGCLDLYSDHPKTLKSTFYSSLGC